MDTPPKYISNTNLSARVGGLNPRWNEDQSAERTDAQFLKAVQLTGSEFLESVDYISKVTAPGSPLPKLEDSHPCIKLDAIDTPGYHLESHVFAFATATSVALAIPILANTCTWTQKHSLKIAPHPS